MLSLFSNVPRPAIERRLHSAELVTATNVAARFHIALLSVSGLVSTLSIETITVGRQYFSRTTVAVSCMKIYIYLLLIDFIY